jgi:hypothetical protein
VPPILFRNTRRLAAALALVAFLPATGWTWGAVGHRYIAQNYSKHLPAYMDGLRSYDATIYTHVTDPDTRKSTTPGEAEKHYIDIDWYPEWLAGTFPRDRAALEAIYGSATVIDEGIVPWAVTASVSTLTSQFQAQNWSGAALTIADLCHYVGDANQPLHVTNNYDGGLTGNNGIHSRYESTMIGTYVGQLSTPTLTARYFPSAQDAIFDVILPSWSDVALVIAADNTAKAASGGSYNSTYYASLWNSTRIFTQARMDTASWMTASYVYTAWINAGQPAIPGSSVGVPAPLAADLGVRLSAGPSPFRGALTVRFAAAQPVSVEVFDVRGARVARLADGVAGEGAATWRPDESHAAPGLYFVRLSGAGRTLVRRVTLLD